MNFGTFSEVWNRTLVIKSSMIEFQIYVFQLFWELGLSFLSCAPIIRNPWASLTNVSIIISATVTIVPRSVKIKLYLAHSVLFCVVSSLLCPIAHMARIVLSNKTESEQLFRIFYPFVKQKADVKKQVVDWPKPWDTRQSDESARIKFRT